MDQTRGLEPTSSSSPWTGTNLNNETSSHPGIQEKVSYSSKDSFKTNELTYIHYLDLLSNSAS